MPPAPPPPTLPADTADLAVCHAARSLLRPIDLPGADATLADHAGNTALHHCLLGANPDAVGDYDAERIGYALEELLQYGADPDAANQAGQTPRQLAARMGLTAALDKAAAEAAQMWQGQQLAAAVAAAAPGGCLCWAGGALLDAAVWREGSLRRHGSGRMALWQRCGGRVCWPPETCQLSPAPWPVLRLAVHPSLHTHTSCALPCSPIPQAFTSRRMCSWGLGTLRPSALPARSQVSRAPAGPRARMARLRRHSLLASFPWCEATGTSTLPTCIPTLTSF